MAQDSPTIALDSHVLNPATETNEKHRIKVDGSGGTWDWHWDGEEVEDISATATAAQLKAAIVNDSRLTEDDIVVTGGPGNAGGSAPYFVEFVGDYAGQDVPLATALDELTGGGAAVTITTEVEGGQATKAVRRGAKPLADATDRNNPLAEADGETPRQSPSEHRTANPAEYGDS